MDRGIFKKIIIGSDHAAIETKRNLVAFLESEGIEVIDKGPNTSDSSLQFSDVVEEVALEVSKDSKDEIGGILICGNGVGMSVAANKIPGIRAGVCNELFTAKYAKRDVHLNVLCMGARIIGERLMQEITQTWIEQEYGDGRFARRVILMEEMASKYIS